MPYPVNRSAKSVLWMIALFLLSVLPVEAYGSLVTDKVLELANPNQSHDAGKAGLSRIAAVPRSEIDSDGSRSSASLRHQSALVADRTRTRERTVSFWDAVARRNMALFPGTGSLDRMQKDLVRVAALPESTVSVARKEAQRIVDREEDLSSLGILVGDPRSLFASFEILVDRATYTVRLYGIRPSDKRKLLFECRAGLGSPEYPTPKGMYYIVRIFDDKPLWIPPQDREWAFGQVPSRSVYGGHMMPFCTKQQISQGGGATPSATEEMPDHVAPPVKMVDGGMYRIHGTDSPWSVGSAQSHGCVRLLNSSVAQLSDTLKMYVGTTTRGEAPNGPYVNLARPVRLILF